MPCLLRATAPSRASDAPPLAAAEAPHPAPQKRMLYCSFCGKSQHEVQALVAGPAICVCDECVGLCNDVIADKEILSILQADEANHRQEQPNAERSRRGGALPERGARRQRHSRHARGRALGRGASGIAATLAN